MFILFLLRGLRICLGKHVIKEVRMGKYRPESNRWWGILFLFTSFLFGSFVFQMLVWPGGRILPFTFLLILIALILAIAIETIYRND